jgi:hypothetical protein
MVDKRTVRKSAASGSQPLGGYSTLRFGLDFKSRLRTVKTDIKFHKEIHLT